MIIFYLFVKGNGVGNVGLPVFFELGASVGTFDVGFVRTITTIANAVFKFGDRNKPRICQEPIHQ